MAVVYIFGLKGDDFKTVFRQQTLEAEADTADPVHTVAVPETAHHRADNVIYTGTKTAAGNDSRMDMTGGEKNLFARSGFFQQFRTLARPDNFVKRGIEMVADKIAFRHIVGDKIAVDVGKFNGRCDLAGTQRRNCKIKNSIVHIQPLKETATIYLLNYIVLSRSQQ